MTLSTNLLKPAFLTAFIAVAMMLFAPLAIAQSDDEPVVLEMILGDEDAPVTMYEYASFTCPHCARYHTTIYPSFKRDYIDTGKVRLIYREVYFDKLGIWGGLIARCAGPEKYFGIVDLLYRRAEDWVRAGNAGATAQVLQQIGRVAGLNDEEITACLKDTAKAEAMVAVFQANAKEHGITGTPSFIINGEPQANVNYPELQEVLDAAVAKATQ